LYVRPIEGAAQRARVGIVGLGNMGGRIARRAVAAGFAVQGFDLDERRAAACGIDSAASARDLAASSDVVLLSLPDSGVVEPVVRSIRDACRPGAVVVDLSTSAPSSTVVLHAELADAGIAYVDAGISGGAAAAESGTLTVMAGGDAAAVDFVQPVLATFSSRIVHMGGSGSGHTAKLLNNFLNGVSLAATAEVMVAGRKAGLDPRLLLDVLNHSSGVNFATLNRFPRIIEGDYLEGGLTGNLMLKDLRLYRDLAAGLGVRSLGAEACIAAFELAAELGYGELISNRVVDAIGDVSGGVRLHEVVASVNESEGTG
jgi:3-hydroxyisobutyrate dehydrogenase-like beta-hydroxyacid dehydrogenase